MKIKDEPTSKTKKYHFKDDLESRDQRSTQVISSTEDEIKIESKSKKIRSSKAKIIVAKEIIIKKEEPKRERSNSKKVKFESKAELGPNNESGSVLGKRSYTRMKAEQAEAKTKTRKKTPKNKEKAAKAKFLELEAEEGEEDDDAEVD